MCQGDEARADVFASTSQAIKPEQSVMQALESLTDAQVENFLCGRAPLHLTMRLGDHVMFVQLQLCPPVETPPATPTSPNCPVPPTPPAAATATPQAAPPADAPPVSAKILDSGWIFGRKPRLRLPRGRYSSK
ncbi:hypothetical protein HPB48_022676 [Haemaphysalis longicornis]|uniref:Uncharacterized protein n=1 Tax=Haemaphysalis longicornis TaxID=44386 RepID=A0A9J6FTI0_HAELO|nr:hypothetical protein HPB48_022676 [Haemaphysalis longicornis]